MNEPQPTAVRLLHCVLLSINLDQARPRTAQKEMLEEVEASTSTKTTAGDALAVSPDLATVVTSFVFPPQLQNPHTGARLWLFAKYGPTVPLRGGAGLSRPLTETELSWLVRDEENDFIEQAQMEGPRLLRDAMSYSVAEVGDLLQQSAGNFHAMQKLVLEDRETRLRKLRKMKSCPEREPIHKPDPPSRVLLAASCSGSRKDVSAILGGDHPEVVQQLLTRRSALVTQLSAKTAPAPSAQDVAANIRLIRMDEPEKDSSPFPWRKV